jgi:hypothetical protein
LILAGIADVFFTVLHPDGFGLLSSRLYGGLFKTVRLLTRPLPRRLRALGLSIAAPLMVPVTIIVWIVLVLVGYALVYYAGMNAQGFRILTLAISYVVGVYGVLQQLGVTAAGLLHQASDTAEPLSILAPHFPDGEPRDIEPQVVAQHSSLVGLYEGLRRYPIIYYYHSRRACRSLPYTFRVMGGVAGALRWGLPKGHPAR